MPCCACTTGRGLRGDRVETSISGCIAAWHINRLFLLAIGQTLCSLYANRCIQAEIYSHLSSFLPFTSAPVGSSGQQGDRARSSAPVRRPIATLHLACFLTACTHWTSINLTRPPLDRSHARAPPLSLSSSLLQLSCSDARQGGQRTNNPPSPSPPVAIEWLPQGSRDAPPPLLPPKAQSRRHHSAWWQALEPAQGLGSLKEPLAGSGSISKAQGH